MIPMPSIAQLKSAFDAVMKVVGFVKEKVEEFEPKQHGSSETVLYRPGRDEIIKKILHGKFPAIPGTYFVKIDGNERTIAVYAIVIEMNVFWQFKDIGADTWWALDPKDIAAIEWLELISVSYD